MHRSWVVSISALIFVSLSAANAPAIEYNLAEPEQRFAGKGWLIDSGNDHGVVFKTYLESKQLIINEDGIYYRGTDRVEGVDGAPRGTIRWHYLARCAVPPSKIATVPIGLWVSDKHVVEPASGLEPFMEVDLKDAAPSNAMKGWYSLWWAVCRNQARSFAG
jgi:hypothetical protein